GGRARRRPRSARAPRARARARRRRGAARPRAAPRRRPAARAASPAAAARRSTPRRAARAARPPTADRFSERAIRQRPRLVDHLRREHARQVRLRLAHARQREGALQVLLGELAQRAGDGVGAVLLAAGLARGRRGGVVAVVVPRLSRRWGDEGALPFSFAAGEARVHEPRHAARLLRVLATVERAHAGEVQRAAAAHAGGLPAPLLDDEGAAAARARDDGVHAPCERRALDGPRSGVPESGAVSGARPLASRRAPARAPRWPPR